jgi:hypothetical protein
MSRYDDFEQHEKQLTPWLSVRYFMAARPELRRRAGDLDRIKAEAFLAAEDQRVRHEVLREASHARILAARRRYLAQR